ncbi:mobilization protein [Bacteroides sp. Marseille-P3684]|uniref:mobilization protein n=1 Tax=Bacteroides sp. Marseille-P3684 TaxID=2086579 RepID=UPI000D0AD538|nr:mobilization protein [Bacteroides sp. Marseille-P3684]
MATKSSIHIKPCNVASSEAHNRRTAEYMRNIGKSKVYVVSELSANNEQWINPDFGSPELQMHYENIKRMVKEKTGRAMQEKERERKGKNGKIIKVAGCSPIREGVLLIRPDTTLADVHKFGEECQRRWGITPLQIFLHKDEGHWLNGQPDPEDRESFKVGERWFKPNYHAHIVFDWMNHDTGKSRKLNDDDMMQMQTLASDILLMERGKSKAVTGKEHLERNDFIIEKQKAELQRIETIKRHKEQQVNLAEQELRQVKSEIRTDKLKSAATDAATVIASGVGSLFGSGKMKKLEQSNDELRQEIAKRDKGIDDLKAQMQRMQEQHGKQIRNLQGIHNQELEAKDKEISRLNTLLEKAFKWFPMLREMLRMEKLCAAIGFTKEMIESLLTKKEAIRCNGRIYSEEHRRKFDIKNDVFKVEKNPADNGKLVLTINRQPIGEWFKEQWEKLRQGLRQSTEEPRKSRGFRRFIRHFA